jgi:hypothetical protein
LAWTRGRSLADLVQEEGPAIGLLEQALALRDGAAERAPDMPEQLVLEQLVGQGGAAHGDERLPRPGAARVDGLRRQLLAGAALAGDQHGAIHLGEAGEPLLQLPYRAAVADDAVGRRGLAHLGFEPCHFLGESPLVERIAHAEQELLVLERLADEIEGAQLDGLDGGREGAEGGHQDDLDLGLLLLDHPEQIHPGHRIHPQVRDDQIEAALAQPPDRPRPLRRPRSRRTPRAAA